MVRTKPTVDFEVIAKAVGLACRAPSLHNSQPWHWVASRTAVDLYADPHRVVRSADSWGREALIGCGLALDHFRVAMAAAGWNTTVEQFPEPDKPDHLATITLTPLDFVTPEWRDRADAILRRRTDRLPFRAPAESLERVLRNSISGLATLDVLADDMHPQLAEVARLTESIRSDDDLYHHELQWWTTSFRLSEGVPPSALISDSERHRVAVNRNFRLSGNLDRRGATPRDQAKIVVLSTPADTREDAFNCGQVLSKLLLDCTMAGMATATMTHVTEMEASRDVVRRLTARNAVPQVLIRVGIAPSIEDIPAPTPRRSMRDVLEIRR